MFNNIYLYCIYMKFIMELFNNIKSNKQEEKEKEEEEEQEQEEEQEEEEEENLIDRRVLNIKEINSFPYDFNKTTLEKEIYNNNFTVSLWIFWNPLQSKHNNNYIILSTGDIGDNINIGIENKYFYIEINSTKLIGPKCEIYIWQHIVFTFNNNKLEIYLDGNLFEKNVIVTYKYMFDKKIQIGNKNNNDIFVGKFNEFNIYNYALNINEINNEYQNKKINYEKLTNDDYRNKYFILDKKDTYNTNLDSRIAYYLFNERFDNKDNICMYKDEIKYIFGINHNIFNYENRCFK